MLTLAACVDLGVDPGPVDELRQASWDELRIVAVRTQPPIPLAGQAYTVEALAIGPEAPRRWTVETCGDDHPRPVIGRTCFTVEEQVRVADGPATLPLTLTAPRWTDFPPAACLDPDAWTHDTGLGQLVPPESCAHMVSLRLTVGAGRDEHQVLFSVPVSDARFPEASLSPIPDLQVTVGERQDDGGVPVRVTLPLAEADRPPQLPSPALRWYPSAGRVRNPARTAGVWDATGWWTENVLYASEPVRLAVVLVVEQSPWGQLVQNPFDRPRVEAMRWSTVEVTP